MRRAALILTCSINIYTFSLGSSYRIHLYNCRHVRHEYSDPVIFDYRFSPIFHANRAVVVDDLELRGSELLP